MVTMRGKIDVEAFRTTKARNLVFSRGIEGQSFGPQITRIARMGFEFVSDFELRISILDSPFGIRHLAFEIPSAAPRQFSLWSGLSRAGYSVVAFPRWFGLPRAGCSVVQ